mgnify:CR=1 FL=1
MGALSATWKPAIREKFEPLVPNIEFVEAGNVEALHDAFAETGQGKYGKGPVAAVIMELIQGEAGVMPLGADYVRPPANYATNIRHSSSSTKCRPASDAPEHGSPSSVRIFPAV